jgi:hypothetical protein
MTDGKSWLSSIHGHLLKWAAGILLSVAIILYLGADLPQWLAVRRDNQGERQRQSG